ncbi:MAG: LPS export ABC transporter permease LptG [Rickettsiales bacterium]|nr:LPS export ABC transporter permease LptG [Pseudomonadota bacterium]MDA0966517.1 LPS export ABC transporter permease LptG [Pseudomonadota bacterium]MDG4543379.1 LPS export ABC transporter permease LptG [Rickettsiales bacterium]MDG4545645.1 LPS export ABC transporter permease LptG [Rickettsiales bacterium]MDG4548094.1 LPS export ABC transporter permease LptG [Rickettsiales bacterium]
MRLPITLSIYISKNFIGRVGVVLFVMMVTIILFDSLELVRRAYSKDVPIGIILQMTLLKLPTIVQKVVPFAILIGGILSFSKLTRTSELVVARSAGISAWQFLSPAIIISFTLGIFIMTVFNPLASTMLSKFEQIEAKYLKGGTSTLSVSSNGLWLRQKNSFDSGKTVINALRVSHENMELYDVTIFMFGDNNEFLQRVDAAKAILIEEEDEEGDKKSYWDIKDAVLTVPGMAAAARTDYRLGTELSRHHIQESFASPETMSFWELPKFIGTLKDAGFSAIRHSLHWHNVLVTPFFLAAMVFFAAAFSLRPPRRGKTGALMVAGIASGFIIYFISNLVLALGLSGSIPVIVSAWTPACVSILIGTVLILHLEDG